MATPVIDARAASAAYADAFRKLAALSGFSGPKVLRAECGSFLKAWAGDTKVATVEKADRRSRLHAVKSLGYTQAEERGDVTVNAGWRPAPFGRVWIRVRHGSGKKNFLLAKGQGFSAPTGSGTFTMYRRQLYNPKKRGDTDRSTSYQWMENVTYAQSNIEHRLPRSIDSGRRSVALARQSVVQIADEMGIDLNNVAGGRLSAAGIAKARAALASNGRAYKNGSGYIIGDETVKAYADMVNRLPYNTKIGMDFIANSTLQRRAKFIETAWAKGVFESAVRVAKQFPNLVRVAA